MRITLRITAKYQDGKFEKCECVWDTNKPFTFELPPGKHCVELKIQRIPDLFHENQTQSKKETRD